MLLLIHDDGDDGHDSTNVDVDDRGNPESGLTRHTSMCFAFSSIAEREPPKPSTTSPKSLDTKR